MLSSYEADFAAGWGYKVLSILEECGQQFFGIRISEDRHTAA